MSWAKRGWKRSFVGLSRPFAPVWAHADRLALGALIASALWGCSAAAAAQPRPAAPPAEARAPRDDSIDLPGGVYTFTGSDRLAPELRAVPYRIYVPNVSSNDVDVIDPALMRVVDHYRVGHGPQHVVPSWDLKSLWVTGSANGKRILGSLTRIDPITGKVVAVLPMEDAYNMYYTPDGRSAVVVAESRRRLEFRDPQTMAMQGSVTIPDCIGLNHADYSGDFRYAIFTCEFDGALVKVDMAARKVLGLIHLAKRGMPQDIRVAPDGRTFYVANMMTDGIHVIDGNAFVETGFIPTGIGTHGLYPSRDGRKLYISNRGSRLVAGGPHGPGSVAVLDFATRRVETVWPIPGGGSPDMGGVSLDGRTLWLSGRFDNVVYAIDTTTGAVQSVRVGSSPHGLAVWPQPGRFSLGHTGNMR